MNVATADSCAWSALVDMMLVGFRGVVLVTCAVGGILSIYLGWRLYKDSMLVRTEGSAQFANMRFRLVSAGPGVFFAAFGMWLLKTLATQTVQLADEVQVPVTPSHSEAAPAHSAYNVAPAPTWPIAVLRIDANAASAPKPDCVITRRTRSLLGGADDLAPKDIKRELDYTIGELAKGIRSDAPDDDSENENRRRAIKTLRALKAGVQND